MAGLRPGALALDREVSGRAYRRPTSASGPIRPEGESGAFGGNGLKLAQALGAPGPG